jgi:hypothetical protein
MCILLYYKRRCLQGVTNQDSEKCFIQSTLNSVQCCMMQVFLNCACVTVYFEAYKALFAYVCRTKHSCNNEFVSY